MSNKDTTNENEEKKQSHQDIFQKDEMRLFSYELLKSKKMFRVLQTNSFTYDFSDEKDELNNEKDTNEPKMKINNRTISLIDEENNSSLKTLNLEVSSSRRLSQKEFQNNFLKEYDTSFAKFCGLNKEQYENIYIKNSYIPKIDSFGNIKINIKNIIEVLKEIPSEDKMSNKKLIKFKKILKGNKKNQAKKLKFRILRKKLNKKIKIPTILTTPVRKIIDVKNNSASNSSNNLQRSSLGFNIKNKGKGLSISIPKNTDIFKNRLKLNLGNNKSFPNLIPNKTLTFPKGNNFNKNIISNIPNKPNINPLTINSVLSNSRQQTNNDIFNFSNRDIRNYLNLGNNYLNNNTLSPNFHIYTPIISPFPISPYQSLFSAHINNGIILPDGNNYNNTLLNPNSFIFPNNSPALINININNNFNLNNNVVNGNILNNNIGSQNISFKNSNSNNNSVNNSINTSK